MHYENVAKISQINQLVSNKMGQEEGTAFCEKWLVPLILPSCSTK